MPREHLLKIGVSGIRGVVGDFLTPLARLSPSPRRSAPTWAAAASWSGATPASSGPMLQHAVTCGLLAAGCEVVDVGILPTPTIQIYAGATRARGGIAITASHNPPEYNALKLFNAEGLFFNNYERSELLDLYHQSDFRQAGNDEILRLSTDYDAPPRHAHGARAQARGRRSDPRAQVPGGARRGERRRLGDDRRGSCRTPWAASCTPSPSIPPSPSRASPSPVPRRWAISPNWCAANHCEIGFAQDPDGDRLAVVDETRPRAR